MDYSSVGTLLYWLGHVLLEEHSPHGIGNHAVILTECCEELERKIKGLLEQLHYVGFSRRFRELSPA